MSNKKISNIKMKEKISEIIGNFEASKKIINGRKDMIIIDGNAMIEFLKRIREIL